LVALLVFLSSAIRAVQAAARETMSKAPEAGHLTIAGLLEEILAEHIAGFKPEWGAGVGAALCGAATSARIPKRASTLMRPASSSTGAPRS